MRSIPITPRNQNVMDDLDLNQGSQSGSANGQNKVGMALGLIGVVGLLLGATGVFMANSSKGTVAELKQKVDDISAQADQSAAMEAKLVEMEQRLATLGQRVDQGDQVDRQFREQVQKAFDTVGKEIRANREQAAEPVAKKKEAASSGSGGSSPVAGEGKVHAIEKGDTLGKLADKYGVTLEAIVKANPGIEPTKLQIGQKVRIP